MLVVQMFGGPGAGKTALALAVAAQLKMAHPSVVSEFASEATKEFVWENRESAMKNRLLILGEQSFRLSRLDPAVQVAVTDSPVLLNAVYGAREGWPRSYADLCLHAHRAYPSINVMVRRPEGAVYEPAGRREDEETARALDAATAACLEEAGVEFVCGSPDWASAARIAALAAGMAAAG